MHSCLVPAVNTHISDHQKLVCLYSRLPYHVTLYEVNTSWYPALIYQSRGLKRGLKSAVSSAPQADKPDYRLVSHPYCFNSRPITLYSLVQRCCGEVTDNSLYQVVCLYFSYVHTRTSHQWLRSEGEHMQRGPINTEGPQKLSSPMWLITRQSD